MSLVTPKVGEHKGSVRFNCSSFWAKCGTIEAWNKILTATTGSCCHWWFSDVFSIRHFLCAILLVGVCGMMIPFDWYFSSLKPPIPTCMTYKYCTYRWHSDIPVKIPISQSRIGDGRLSHNVFRSPFHQPDRRMLNSSQATSAFGRAGSKVPWPKQQAAHVRWNSCQVV